jgi:hypothetical protein
MRQSSVSIFATGRSNGRSRRYCYSCNAQAAAEALGLKVHRSVTSGARVRQIPRDEAEIAVECLRDWGFSARILENAPRGESASERGATKAA